MSDFSDEINRFTIAREELGISQRELARITGIHHSVIARIENGEIERPNMNILLILCKTLQLNFVDILVYYGHIDYDVREIGIIKGTPLFIEDEKEKQHYKKLYDKYKNNLEKAFKDYKSDKLDFKELINIIQIIVGVDLSKYTKK